MNTVIPQFLKGLDYIFIFSFTASPILLVSFVNPWSNVLLDGLAAAQGTYKTS
jgi:hypothetical protein